MMPIAKQHSAGLDYVYSKLLVNTSRSTNIVSKQQINEIAKPMLTEFAHQNKVLIEKDIYMIRRLNSQEYKMVKKIHLAEKQ